MGRYWRWILMSSSALLNHMRQLMRQQPLPFTSLRLILPFPKHHISPHCIGQGIHRLRRFHRSFIGMHPHLAEIVPEARLHEVTCIRVQGLTAGRKHILDYGRYLVCCFLFSCYPHALAHTQPPISASVSGFSHLAYSVLAARSKCIIRTGSFASAARNAAFSMILRMFPPVTFSRASLLTSRFFVGIGRGKMRRQISARCSPSGKGKWTMKRMRRRKAVSNALLRFVVRIARPR